MTDLSVYCIMRRDIVRVNDLMVVYLRDFIFRLLHIRYYLGVYKGGGIDIWICGDSIFIAWWLFYVEV